MMRPHLIENARIPTTLKVKRFDQNIRGAFRPRKIPHPACKAVGFKSAALPCHSRHVYGAVHPVRFETGTLINGECTLFRTTINPLYSLITPENRHRTEITTDNTGA